MEAAGGPSPFLLLPPLPPTRRCRTLARSEWSSALGRHPSLEARARARAAGGGAGFWCARPRAVSVPPSLCFQGLSHCVVSTLG